MTSPEEHYGALGQATGALLGQQATSPPRYWHALPNCPKYTHTHLLQGTKEAFHPLRTQGTEAGRGRTSLGKTGDDNRTGNDGDGGGDDDGDDYDVGGDDDGDDCDGDGDDDGDDYDGNGDGVDDGDGDDDGAQVPGQRPEDDST